MFYLEMIFREVVPGRVNIPGTENYEKILLFFETH